MSSNDRSGAGAEARAHEIRAQPVRKPGLWVLSIVSVAFVLFVLWTLLTSPNVHWDVVGHYVFSVPILQGLLVTIQLTILCEVLGVSLGVVVAVMRLSQSTILRTLSAAYTWFFRSIPLLVQLIFWFNLGLLFPKLGFPPLMFSTNDLINGFVAAALGLTLHEAAYNGEIVRGGILAVDKGQVEASQALGMNRLLSLRRIVLPQAIRVIIPPLGNQFISLLKNTSLVAFIAGGDLLSTAQNIYAGNFEVIALLVVASLWYLTIVSIGSFLQSRLELRFGRGVAGSAKRAPRRRRQPSTVATS